MLQSFKFATPFNYELAVQFVHMNNIKDDLLEALELQFKYGDTNYPWAVSFSRSNVDQIRLEFKQIKLSREGAALMYLSRLFEMKPFWWNATSMSQLEQLNNIVDQVSKSMKSEMIKIVESGLMNSEKPSLIQNQSTQTLPIIQTKSELELRKIQDPPRSIGIGEVYVKRIEPSSQIIYTNDPVNFIVETDLNVKESDLIIRVSGVDITNETFEKKSNLVLQSTLQRRKQWNRSFCIKNEGLYEFSLEYMGTILLKEVKTFNHRELSLANSISKSNWSKRCMAGKDCSVIIPCVNINNSHQVKQFKAEDIKAIVRCGNSEWNCKVSVMEKNLVIDFKCQFVGEAVLQFKFGDQQKTVEFTADCQDVNWSKMALINSENVQIQDSKWIVREKSPTYLEFKICDIYDENVEFLDLTSVRAVLQNFTSSSMECMVEFIPERSVIKVSFTTPSTIGQSVLSIMNSRNPSTSQKYTIDIIRERTFQVAISDRKEGISGNFKKKLKEKANQQFLNLNIQSSQEIQKPDVVLRFIYHNGPPTWSDFKVTLSDENKNYGGASVIMVLATLNKTYWKKDSPDDSFPSGVNLYQSDISIRERGVVWLYYDYNCSIDAIENESEIENLLKLIKKVK